MSGLSSTDPGLMILLDRQRRLSVEDYRRMTTAFVFRVASLFE